MYLAFVCVLRFSIALVHRARPMSCDCPLQVCQEDAQDDAHIFLTSTNDERGLCASAPGLQRKELTGQKRILLREGRSVGASKCVRLNVGVLSSPSRGFGWPSSSGTALHIIKKRKEAFHVFSLTLFACNVVTFVRTISYQLRRCILSASEG